MNSSTDTAVPIVDDCLDFEDVGLSLHEDLSHVDCNYSYCSDIDLDCDSMNIVQWNICGLINKQDAMIRFIRSLGGSNKVNVVYLNETWLCTETSSKVSIPGYKIVNKCRTGKKGSGYVS